MTFNHLKMIPKGKIISFVPIANTFFNWSVWGFGKDFPVGLAETHPILRGLGSVLQWMCVLPRPCDVASLVGCGGCVSY